MRHAVVVAILASVVACDRGARPADPAPPAPVAVPAPAPVPVPAPVPAALCADADCLPGFRMTTIDGTTLTSDDLKNRPVVVMFWASYCEPCVTEGPSIEQVYRRHRDQGFLLVGISRDEGTAADLRKFRDHYGFTYPIALSTPALEDAFGHQEHVPTFMLYGRDGHRKLVMTGALPAKILEEELAKLL